MYVELVIWEKNGDTIVLHVTMIYVLVVKNKKNAQIYRLFSVKRNIITRIKY